MLKLAQFLHWDSLSTQVLYWEFHSCLCKAQLLAGMKQVRTLCLCDWEASAASCEVANIPCNYSVSCSFLPYSWAADLARFHRLPAVPGSIVTPPLFCICAPFQRVGLQYVPSCVRGGGACFVPNIALMVGFL